MNKFAIVSDTTCDLGENFQKQFDIRVIPGHIILPDSTEIDAFLSWDKYNREKFYEDVKNNPNAYSTSPPNIKQYYNEFEKIIIGGCKQILFITISSALSGAYGFACQARNEIVKTYKDVQIECIDSMRFGPGCGLMIVNAAKLRDQGHNINEVAEYLEKNKNRYRQCGWLDDLDYAAKKGRISHPQAFLGKLVGIKPIGEIDSNGLTTVIGKVKGTKKAFSVLISYIKETIENAESQSIFIAHTCRYNQAIEYAELIKKEIKPKEVVINDVFPVCGINIGLGLLAAYYVGKPISENLEEEKRIIEKYNK